MKRTLNKIVLAILTVVAVVALLPISGVFTRQSCTWTSDASAKSTRAPTDPALTSLALSVKAGSPEVTKLLRDDLTARLKTHGVTEIVDNPVTRPRIQVVVEEMRGRWTPFWAPMLMKARLFVDLKRGNSPHAVDAAITVEGTCWGLVSKDVWRDEPLALVAKGVEAALFPQR